MCSFLEASGGLWICQPVCFFHINKQTEGLQWKISVLTQTMVLKYVMYAILLSPWKSEKLSHSNCRQEIFNPAPCCYPSTTACPGRARAPMPEETQEILWPPRVGCFSHCLPSSTVPKVIQRFSREHYLVTRKLYRLFQETKQFKELQKLLFDLK